MNLKTWIALPLALLGGAAFQLLHIPLAWLLGPMTAIMIWREGFGRKALWHNRLWDIGLTVLGFMMGRTFTASVALQIVQLLPSMAAATLLTVGFTLFTGWLTARQTGISMASGLIGSTPGGLSQMVVLSSEIRDADMTVVTFMQTIRLMAVIFIVPFLAVHGLSPGAVGGGKEAPAVYQTAAPTVGMDSDNGVPENQGTDDEDRSITASAAPLHNETSAVKNSGIAAAGTKGIGDAAKTGSTGPEHKVPWLHLNTLWYILAVGGMTWLAPRIHLPTPYMLGPMLAAAVLRVSGIEAPELPGLVIIGAQIMVGARMGVNTCLSSLANWRKLLPYAVLGGVGIVVFSLGIGYMLTWWHPMSFTTAFLGAAPGGMTEMGLTGAAVHADLSIIVAYQMFRILFVLFIVPFMLKGLLKAADARSDFAGGDFKRENIDYSRKTGHGPQHRLRH